MMQDEIICEAHALYAAGLNVFPIPFAMKDPYDSTSILKTTRIHLSSIDQLFADSNIAVMTGRLSGNLFVLDCDDDETFEYVGEQSRRRNIRAWIRLGMRGGQYWLRCAEGEVQSANLGKLQVLGNALYTVAPPSVHPEGVIYEWARREGQLPPSVSIRQLDFLNLSLAGNQKPAIKRDKTTLPPAAYRVLVEEDTTGYHSNSEAEYAACLSLLQAGFPDFMIRTIFAQFNPPHYAKRRGRSFDKHTLASAHEWLLKQEGEIVTAPKQTQPHSSHFVQYADSRPWPGRTGTTDKAIYLALCERMRKDRGERVFRASVRELSEMANVGTQAVQASLKRLRAAELVKYESKDSISGACLYSLNPQEEMMAITTRGEAYTAVADNVVMSAMQQDAFHARGLGRSAYGIWRVLQTKNRSMTVKEIAEVTGRAYSTIRQNMKKLATCGLTTPECTKDSIRWHGVAVTHEKLEELAAALGTSGKAAVRKARHIEERQKRASVIILRQKHRFSTRHTTRRTDA